MYAAAKAGLHIHARVPVTPCRHDCDRNGTGISDIRVTQQSQQAETIGHGHLYISQYQIIIQTIERENGFFCILAGRAFHPVAPEHVFRYFQKDAVIIHYQYMFGKYRRRLYRKLLCFRFFCRFRKGKRQAECCAFTWSALYFNASVQYLYKSFRDKKPKTETFRVYLLRRTLERTEDTFQCLLVHTDTGITDLHI